jgi:hypothetical protein
VADKLIPNGKLAPLAIKMIDKTVEWISKVHKHLDAELLKLTQQHITAEDALILLSEDTDRAHATDGVCGKSRQQGGLHDKVHLDHPPGLSGHARVRAGRTPEQFDHCDCVYAFSGEDQLKTLTDKVEKLQTAAATATTVSKNALKDSKEALTRASTANTQADTAKNAVHSLYAKNPTLKR